MNTPLRLAAFASGLVVVFAAAAGIGNAIGPVIEPSDTGTHGTDNATTAGVSPGTAVKGLSVSQDGYTLDLEQDTHPVGAGTPFAFAITGPGGQPVTSFTPTHEKDLHLIVVRRDTTGYQHLHPQRDASGRWSIPLTLPTAGAYKVFADFAPGDSTDALTLAADLSAPGSYEPQSLPTETRTAQVDGYTVDIDGDLVPGQDAAVTLRVSKDGQPVTDLDPYLGSYGHLVALRAGDLAYLHVHPQGEPGDGSTAAGPDISFAVEVPTDGTYRLYLDFQHEDVVRTAAFTLGAEAAPVSTPDEQPATDEQPAHGDGDQGH